MASTRIRLGISSCLLGEAVRYDGGHKHDAYITATLGRFFDFVSVCPEVAIGLGVPRPPIRLARQTRGVRAQGAQNPALDVTERLAAYAGQVAPSLSDVSGYILKQKSPSCGMQGVPVYPPQGAPLATGTGVYALALMQRLPELPFEEEQRLTDPAVRQNFLQRVFVYYRWQRLAPELTPLSLVDFHARHEFILLAHDETAYGELGRLVAGAGGGKIDEHGAHYVRQLMQCLKKPATRTRHANVLQHALGFLQRDLDADDKTEMLALIERYRLGQTPWVVPIAMMQRHLRRFPQPYLEQQYYLAPHPDELALQDLA